MSDFSDVAVLIPCYNEVHTIACVVDQFGKALPGASIYVYDNNSYDGSDSAVKDSGAILRRCPVQGKGAVVKQMFSEVDAERYIMVDADDTYPAEAARDLLSALAMEHYDFGMVLGDRLSSNYFDTNERPFHGFGNKIVRHFVNRMYNGTAFDAVSGEITDVPDIMTGYRAFSRSFVKSVRLIRDGFEVETEMTIRALQMGVPIAYLPVEYRNRPDNSTSKLSTFSDGAKVIRTIFEMRRN